MRDAYEGLLRSSGHDPVIGGGFLVLSLLIVILGGLHLFRIFGGFLLLVIHEFKHELCGIGKVIVNIRRALSSWK